MEIWAIGERILSVGTFRTGRGSASAPALHFLPPSPIPYSLRPTPYSLLLYRLGVQLGDCFGEAFLDGLDFGFGVLFYSHRYQN